MTNTMETFQKKRISVIVEPVYKDKVIALIEKSGASGFTIYKGICGKGRHGVKENFGSLNEFSSNIEIVTITSDEVALKILEELQKMIEKDISLIVHVLDTIVIRNNHFN